MTFFVIQCEFASHARMPKSPAPGRAALLIDRSIIPGYKNEKTARAPSMASGQLERADKVPEGL